MARLPPHGHTPKEELKAKQLEKVIYFAANLVVSVDEDQRHEDLESLEAEVLAERDAIEQEREGALARRHEELEGELAAGGWLPTALDPELVFQDAQQRTWREAIRAIGGEVAGMEDLPPDVSWN